MLNSGPIDKQGLTVLDIGAEVGHYKADISRTWAPVIATPRQQAIYDAVMDTYEWAKLQLKPGVLWKEYEEKVAKYHARHLKRLGVITKMDKKTVREFYPHYTSHSLGLDTHDAADYDLPLAPNMVFTIEPGIYLPAEGIGVRVEDDFLLTEHGLKNMSEDLARNLVI
jgi:Xaa-Pro aminopeptidase